MPRSPTPCLLLTLNEPSHAARLPLTKQVNEGLVRCLKDAVGMVAANYRSHLISK